MDQHIKHSRDGAQPQQEFKHYFTALLVFVSDDERRDIVLAFGPAQDEKPAFLDVW
jgi:hypothetical protein